MTKEELKKKLQGAWYAQRRLEIELYKRQELQSKSQRTTPAYSQAPGGSGDGKALENTAIENVEQEQKVKHCREELYKQLDEVRALIGLLPLGREQEIMHLRYGNFLKWEQIADEMRYKDVRGAFKAHNRALEMILRKVNRK